MKLVMLGLRTATGLDSTLMKSSSELKLQAALKTVCPTVQEAGLLEVRRQRLRLTDKGIFYCQMRCLQGLFS